MPPDILNLIVNIFSGICIVIALVQIIGVLLVRYSKNYRLTALYFTCLLFFAPWSAWAYGNRGFARLELKEFDKSMKDCNRAIKLNPHLHWVYNNRGIIHERAKRYKEALMDFDRSIKLKADYKPPYANRGTVYLALKQYTRAIQEYDHSLEIDAKYAVSHHNKGCAYLKMNDFQNGYACIMQAFTLKPNSIHMNWTYEWCKMCFEQPDNTTIERLEKLSKLEPESHIVYTSRGVASLLRGNFEAAAKELEQTIALEPDAEDAYFWIGMVYASLGYDEEALVALRQAQKLDVPAVLMTPLYLLEKTRPVFFERHAKQFLAV